MKRLTWRVRLTALFALVLGASLLFQILYIVPHLQRRELEMARTHHQQVSRNIARELDLDIQRFLSRVKLTAQQPQIANMDLPNQHLFLVDGIDTAPMCNSMFVMDAEGWFISGTIEDLSVYTARSYASEPYFAVPFEQGETRFGSPRFYSEEGIVILPISAPIRSESGETVGVLVAEFLLNPAIDNIADYPLPDGTIANVIATESTVIARSGTDLFALETGPLSLTYREDSLTQAIMEGQRSGSREHDHDGVPTFGAWTTMESSGWIVIVEAPMTAILAPTLALVRWLLGVNVALFAVALVISLAVSNQITAERERLESQRAAALEALRESNLHLEETLSELTAAQEQLVRQQRLAAVGQLAAGLAHEINNMMTSVALYSDMMLRSGGYATADVKRLRVIHEQAGKAADLTQQMLDFGRRAILHLDRLNLLPFMQALHEELTEILPKNITLLSEFSSEPIMVEVDPARLRQAITNLSSNAQEAMPAGGELRIQMEPAPPDALPRRSERAGGGSWVRIAVSDTGAGIQPDVLPHIFEPFFTTRAPLGSGLGLSQAYGTIKQHGGQLKVETDVGKGSTFTIYLPVAPTGASAIKH